VQCKYDQYSEFEDMLKYYLELNNLKNKFNLINFGYLKFILFMENMIHHFTNV